MHAFTVIFERIPMVWLLLGLLFNATGLYMGFVNPLAFAYMIVGWFCCAYGIALYVFRLQQRPRASTATRLSPNFISAGSDDSMPSISNVEDVRTSEQADAG